MPGVGWAAYQGEDPAFYTEQTILEAKAQERIKQAERDGEPQELNLLNHIP
jgi:hypothetical protein